MLKLTPSAAKILKSDDEVQEFLKFANFTVVSVDGNQNAVAPEGKLFGVSCQRCFLSLKTSEKRALHSMVHQ